MSGQSLRCRAFNIAATASGGERRCDGALRSMEFGDRPASRSLTSLANCASRGVSESSFVWAYSGFKRRGTPVGFELC